MFSSERSTPATVLRLMELTPLQKGVVSIATGCAILRLMRKSSCDMKDGQSQVLRAFHDVQLTMLKSSASTTTSYDAKHSLIVNVAMSKMHTKESCDLLIECLTQKDADIFYITKCMQGCIIQGTLLPNWNASPSYMPCLAHMWSAMLSPCGDGWGEEVVVAMMLTLLESINRICIETQDWCEPSQHYKVYEQLGVLGNMVRAAVQVLCTESEGRPSGGLQPESVATLVNTIAHMVDSTAHYPLLTALLHCLVRDLGCE